MCSKQESPSAVHSDQTQTTPEPGTAARGHQKERITCSGLNANSAGYYAEQWRVNNPSAWAFMEKLALREASKRRHVSVSWLIGEVRRKDFSTVDGTPFKVANGYCPAFARMLVRDNPELKPFIDLRKSDCDWYFERSGNDAVR